MPWKRHNPGKDEKKKLERKKEWKKELTLKRKIEWEKERLKKK